MRHSLIAASALLLASVATGSVFAQAPPRDLNKDAREAAARVAEATLVPHEINTIAWRRDLMGKPGLQFYVIFFNNTGQPIDYFVTQGKCSSSNKRLTKPWHYEHGQTGVNKDGDVYGDFVLPASDIDGTHGRSDTYVFCKTVDGKYKQWNGRYYLSDAPIELTIKPLVIDTSGRNQQQQ
jgi:hypothetical protein